MSALLSPLYLACPCCGETDNKPYRHPLHTPEGRFFAEFLGPVYENWPGQVSPECCSPWVKRDVPWLGSSGTRWFEGLHCHLLASQSYWDHVSFSCVVLYTKNTHRVLRNKALYKESKHPTKSKKKLKIKDSKNYDLFLTMGGNSIEYTISSLSMWVWIACAHLCNSWEIYSLSPSQHDDKVLLMCQIQGLGAGIGKSGTYMIIWLNDFRFLAIFLWTVHRKAQRLPWKLQVFKTRQGLSRERDRGVGVRCMVLLEGVLPLPARLIQEGPGTVLVLRRLILLYALLTPT